MTSRRLIVDRRYLHLPVSFDAAEVELKLRVDGAIRRRFVLKLVAENEDYRVNGKFSASVTTLPFTQMSVTVLTQMPVFADLSDMVGRSVIIEAAALPEDAAAPKVIGRVIENRTSVKEPNETSVKEPNARIAPRAAAGSSLISTRASGWLWQQ